jgi:uncharacterized membrane-anchored protein
MFEWLTVVIGVALGITSGHARRTADPRLLFAIVVSTAVIATLASDEIERSWAYLGIDLLQTALAFTIAFLGVRWLRRRSPAR